MDTSLNSRPHTARRGLFHSAISFLRNLICITPYYAHLWFLMRYPIIALSVLICIGPIAYFSSAQPLLGNLFDLNAGPLFFVSLACFTTAWSCMLMIRVIHLHSTERTEFESLPPPKLHLPPWWHIVYALTAVPTIAIVLLTNHDALLWKAFAILCGLVGAFVILLFSWFLQEWLINLKIDSPLELVPNLFWPFFTVSFSAIQKQLREAGPENPSESLLDKIASTLGPGYTNGTKPPRIYREHQVVTAAFAIVLFIYLIVGALRVVNVTTPALASLLLLLLMLTWFFSGIAFFLDRYRIPTIIVPIVLGVISAISPWTDYYYHVEPNPPTITSTCAEQPVNEPIKGSIIIVAANGGGIQSAAWTARVLTGLEEATRSKYGDGRFGQSVRLISAVSGGSVGAMYVTEAYKSGELPQEELTPIVQKAKRSSLDAVTWGFVYPDFARTISPFPITWSDRGTALEKAWIGETTLVTQTLNNWREDAKNGCRPAIIFNTTVSDTGKRLLFTTTNVDMSKGIGQATFPITQDIDIVTATRLSASFPFVTPAARNDVGGSDHIVDGGYYDNYGTSSLVQWLRAQLDRPDNEIDRVLIVQILGAPSDSTETFLDSQSCPTPSQKLSASQSYWRGWFYQAFAPVQTMLRVRETGQAVSSENQIDALKERGKLGDKKVSIEKVAFQFKGADAPLSWHMTTEQQHNIETSWKAEVDSCNGRNGFKQVMTWLASTPPTTTK